MGGVLSTNVSSADVVPARLHLALTAEEYRPGVLLADHDPISRHVVGAALRAASQLRLVGCVDATVPVEAWPRLDQVDVVVLSAGGQEDRSDAVRTLVSHGVRVLVLATRWGPDLLDRVLDAGAAACLVKDTEVSRVAVAALAVASGYVLLSPELLDIRRQARSRPRTPVPGNEPELPITKREYEVLRLLAEGMSTEEAAKSLGVSATTVKSHVSHALPKLHARNRLEAILRIKQDRETP